MLAAEETSAAPGQDAAQDASEAAKKPRKWAAWTHEEEEKFFFALKQVGKDFEKITSQVVSKNKDQVRHYYYRLIKRMNKFLSSDLSIDARNPKDVDSAMLCWWSLLEKFKCSSSKIHLKPRRLKAIVTALEQQRLKDRKKAKKKVKASDTNGVEEPASTNLAASGGVKKKSSTRTPAKPQQLQPTAEAVLEPKPVLESEKIPEKPIAEKPETIDMDSQKQTPSELNPKPVPEAETPVLKIKLQLFPIDDRTKSALEKEKHNPHLELTLKGSKSISSVLQHLSQKWGRSSVANGELRLYPFVLPSSSSPSWSSKDTLCAADVYDAVGRPPIFRLRYGWDQPVREFSLESVRPEPIFAAAVTRIERSEEQCQADTPELSCSWLYDRSTDGFGQRLWRDEDLMGAPSLDCLNALYDPSRADAARYSLTSSVWGGEDTCDGFSFKKKEQLRVIPLRETGSCSSLGLLQSLQTPASSSNADALRSSSLDLYWADSLGALDGSLVQGQSLLLNGNSSLGGGISASLFPDSLDGFPQQPTNILLSPNDLQNC